MPKKKNKCLTCFWVKYVHFGFPICFYCVDFNNWKKDGLIPLCGSFNFENGHCDRKEKGDGIYLGHCDPKCIEWGK